MSSSSSVSALLHVVDRLRDPGGCSWDRQQTWASLRRAVVEEAHEVVDAIDQGDPDAVRDELGDLLFLVVLLARIGQDDGGPDLEDIAQAAVDKMRRRHPHVFGDAAEAPDWQAIKQAETRTPPSVLDRVGGGLPPLHRAARLGDAAARVGFDWPNVPSVRRKVDEELHELDEAIAAGDTAHTQEELGDVLFTLAMLGRHLGTPADAALRGAGQKFERRFRGIESDLAARGTTPEAEDAAHLERAWQHAKERLG